MDIAQLFRYLFTLHSLTIYPLFPPVTLLLNTINPYPANVENMVSS